MYCCQWNHHCPLKNFEICLCNVFKPNDFVKCHFYLCSTPNNGTTMHNWIKQCHVACAVILPATNITEQAKKKQRKWKRSGRRDFGRSPVVTHFQGLFPPFFGKNWHVLIFMAVDSRHLPRNKSWVCSKLCSGYREFRFDGCDGRYLWINNLKKFISKYT